MKHILMDSGFLIDLFAGNAKGNAKAVRIKQAMVSSGARLDTQWECVAEASHKLTNAGRQAMLQWLHDEKAVTLHTTGKGDLIAMIGYMQKYANASKGDGPDVADVALVFLAEKLKAAAVLTVDVNDFQTYRTRKGRPLTIVSWH